MSMLRSKLYEFEMEKKRAATKKIEDSKLDIEFGSQIRSYVLQPYRMIKDHRTKTEVGDVDRVLDGDLQPFIRAYLLARRGRSSETARHRERQRCDQRGAQRAHSNSGQAWAALLACVSIRCRETFRADSQGFDDSLHRAPDGCCVAGARGGRRRGSRHRRAAARRGRGLRRSADAEGSPPPLRKTRCQSGRRLHRRRYRSQAALARAQGEIYPASENGGRGHAPGFGRR